MASKVQDGMYVNLPIGAAASSGNYRQVGKLNTVLLNNTDSSNEAVCALYGVYNIPVVAAGALSVGDLLYTSDGVQVDDVNTGDIVGYLMQAIGGAGTSTVPVKITN